LLALTAVAQLLNHKDLSASMAITIAEREAIARGCGSAFLDTFSFQALPFYVSLGYKVFGELADYPLGHRRYFLRKSLQVNAGSEPPNGSFNPSPR